MADEIFDRIYQEGRGEFHAGFERALSAAGRSLMRGFEVLNRIQFAAPWEGRSKDAGCA